MEKKEPAARRSHKVGVVVSAKMQKTVVVAVERLVRHDMYRKTIKRTSTFMAHDEKEVELVAGFIVFRELGEDGVLRKDAAHPAYRFLERPQGDHLFLQSLRLLDNLHGVILDLPDPLPSDAVALSDGIQGLRLSPSGEPVARNDDIPRALGKS